VFHLGARPDWRLVQFNENAAVFLHESVAGPPALPVPRPATDYPMHSRDEMKRIVSEAADRPDMTLAAWFRGNEPLQQPAIRLATIYLYTGRLDACAHTGVDALARSPIRIRELLMIVGTAFNAMGDYELADLSFKGVLNSPDTDAQMRQQIQAALASRGKR
jgi:hypothetical protein